MGFLFLIVVIFLRVNVNDLRKSKLTFQYSLIWFGVAFALMKKRLRELEEKEQ